jgi:hypothetical protein
MTERKSFARVVPTDRVFGLNWLACTSLVVLVISISSAHLPHRMKLLGLFPIAVGLIMGTAGSFFSRRYFFRAPSWITSGMFLMALSGLIGSTVLTYRLETSTLANPSQQHQLAVAMMRQMERDSAGEIVTPAPAISVKGFRSYLAHRLTQLGSLSSPWSELLWSVEIFAGSTAAAWGLRLGTDQHPQRSRNEEIPP